jgi:hypothetical protein
MMATNEQVLARIRRLYEMIFRHDGFGEMRIEMRILKKRQKEVIIHCGKQYRYVVDFPADEIEHAGRAQPGAGGSDTEGPAAGNR